MLELDAHSQQTKFKQLIKWLWHPEIRSVQRNGAEWYLKLRNFLLGSEKEKEQPK